MIYMIFGYTSHNESTILTVNIYLPPNNAEKRKAKDVNSVMLYIIIYLIPNYVIKVGKQKYINLNCKSFLDYSSIICAAIKIHITEYKYYVKRINF